MLAFIISFCFYANGQASYARLFALFFSYVGNAAFFWRNFVRSKKKLKNKKTNLLVVSFFLRDFTLYLLR